jgi:hypothetical protein
MKYIYLGYFDKGERDMTEGELDECFEYVDHLRANGHFTVEKRFSLRKPP